jgi:hypothetical protein
LRGDVLLAERDAARLLLMGHQPTALPTMPLTRPDSEPLLEYFRRLREVVERYPDVIALITDENAPAS